jgi:hypothetical protein
MQIRGANILGLPVITTEQYPKALGNTVQELKDVLPPESPVVAKTLFSMLTPDVKELLKQKPAVSQVGRRSWVVCAVVSSSALIISLQMQAACAVCGDASRGLQLQELGCIAVGTTPHGLLCQVRREITLSARVSTAQFNHAAA